MSSLCLCPEPTWAIKQNNPRQASCSRWGKSQRTTPNRGWTPPPYRAVLTPRVLKEKITGEVSLNTCANLQYNPLLLTHKPGKTALSIRRRSNFQTDTLGNDPMGKRAVRLINNSTSVANVNPSTRGTIVKIKDFHQMIEVKAGYGKTNAWSKWIKNSVSTLNNSDHYICMANKLGRSKTQAVPFPLGWTSDPMGMRCMIALFQDNLAWGEKSCKTLSLLFPVVQGPKRQPPKTIEPPYLHTSKH